jgi:hypothetical protein
MSSALISLLLYFFLKNNILLIIIFRFFISVIRALYIVGKVIKRALIVLDL